MTTTTTAIVEPPPAGQGQRDDAMTPAELRDAIAGLRDATPAGQGRRELAMWLAGLAGDNAIKCGVAGIDARVALNAGADHARKEALP